MALNFISEKELETLKSTRGARVEDGAVSADKPLYEILREAKEKKDAEFNVRFKNLPPKALDEDETEFLEALDKQRREMEKTTADEELRALTEFQAAIAGRTVHVDDSSERPSPRPEQDQPPPPQGSLHSKRKETPLLVPKMLAVKVQPKRQRQEGKWGSSAAVKKQEEKGAIEKGGSSRREEEKVNEAQILTENASGDKAGGLAGLVSYGTDDEDEDES